MTKEEQFEKIRDVITFDERRLSLCQGSSQAHAIRMQLATKRRHEVELMAEIEKEAAPNCSFCHGHGVVPVWVNGMVTDGDCPNKPYCKGGKIEKEAADMDYYGGFAYWSRNANDLAGASKMCEEWSSEIQAEIDHETKGEIAC